MEKEYMDIAVICGSTVPETRLLPSEQCGGYFAVRRFDRENGHRRPMLSASAILEVGWRSASMDYSRLMKLTSILSRRDENDLLQMYRRMCFNVFAHSRDDHAKNFSWIQDEAFERRYPLRACDLIWNSTCYGEHTAAIDDNGHDPGLKELISVGTNAGIKRNVCVQIAKEIRDKTCALVKNTAVFGHKPDL